MGDPAVECLVEIMPKELRQEILLHSISITKNIFYVVDV